MDQQEQAFLSAAIGVGDERLERRLLVGFHLIRECCRIADDPSWVPRVQMARGALNGAVVAGAFGTGDIELAALDGLLGALGSNELHRTAIYSALLQYGLALYREACLSAALASLEVLDRLWTPECSENDRLEAAYYQGMMLVRGRFARDTSRYVPILLALRARAAGEVEFIALAGVVHISRALLAGNFPLVIREGEKRLRQLRRHPSLRAEGALAHNIAAAYERIGRLDISLTIANRLLDDRYPPFVLFGALDLIGNAFVELGELDAARAAYEVMLLAPTSGLRRLAALGLMNIHARRLEARAFERIHRYLVGQPLTVEGRINFCQISGRGWAKLGDTRRARAAFDEAYQLARECGIGHDIFLTEELIDQLPNSRQAGEALPVVFEVAAHVSAMRAEHAEEIAACLS